MPFLNFVYRRLLLFIVPLTTDTIHSHWLVYIIRNYWYVLKQLSFNRIWLLLKYLNFLWPWSLLTVKPILDNLWTVIIIVLTYPSNESLFSNVFVIRVWSKPTSCQTLILKISFQVLLCFFGCASVFWTWT